MAEYRIFVREKDLTISGEITSLSSLNMVRRFNHSGSWVMQGQGSCPLIGGQGIIVDREGEIVFSGVVKAIEKDMNASQFIARCWKVSGVDDLGLLANRIAVPNPVNFNFSTSAYDTRTGTAESVILQYVDYNCGANAIVKRRFPKFTVATSSGIGMTVTGNARFYNLLDFIYNLAQLGEVGYQVNYDPALDKLVFSVYETQDRSAEVKYSVDFGNLESFRYNEDAPKGNSIITLGQGEGMARAYIVADDTNSIDAWGLVEVVKDQRNEPDSAKLIKWANSVLKENKESLGYSFQTIDLPDIGFRYGVDYFLGDSITVADEGIALTEKVTELKIDMDTNFTGKITPVIGKVKDIPLKATFERLSTLEDRVNQLETSL